ncbi:hypothetical protein [Rathayibacter iranicus]|uniref:Uncharacterized protein n=1 Tax=Rathayibacter iranicus NCPPB 2253 = VKM Ac-1602 TaxID=1328868 RepID=A0ABX5LAZ6_9MICO|nr:hypothetical protein [Rathayibacter iranicus]PWJ62009.1 hypothetical protein B0H03_11332 [Rathayibacter iranicus NCPPB 2253 = VKM Ac-1602]
MRSGGPTLGTNAPIVVTDTVAGSWSGFRPDKIDQLKTAVLTGVR